MACLQGQVLLLAIFVTATIVDNVAQDPVNLALNKIATASTFENSPQLAVDGNLSPYHRDGSCFYTPFASALQWISVDLGDSYIITSVNVTNRGDCCAERLHDVFVEVFSDNNDSPGFCSSHNGAVGAGETISLRCDPPQFGRHVKLSRPTSTNERLAICEMQVYGYGSPNKCSRYARKIGVRLDPVTFTGYQGETTLRACGDACHAAEGCIGFNFNNGQPCVLVHRHAGFIKDSGWSVFLLQLCRE